MKTALIVDDSRIMLEILEAELTSDLLTVVPAVSGPAALEWLESNRADIVTSDINMPEMDGFTFLEQMKRRCEPTSPPFLVISTEERRGLAEEAVADDAIAWITKPFPYGSLSELIHRHLGCDATSGAEGGAADGAVHA